jgi:site-specific recombinase XerD
MKLLFWLVKNKANSAGLAPVYARITIDGKLVEISTGIRIRPHRWIAQGNGHIKGSSDQIRLYNARLNDIRAKIDEIYFDLLRKEKPITPQLIKNIYTGSAKPNYSLMEVLQNLLEEINADPDIKNNTYKSYEWRANCIKEYLEEIKRTDLLCEEMDVRFVKSFFLYLRTQKKYSQNYCGKVIMVLKKTMRKAVELQIIQGSPIEYFKVKKGKKKPIIHLSEEEFALLGEHTFRSQRLQQVAHLFLVQCCTGLAYAELSKLSRSMIRAGVDGREWINIERSKIAGAFCQIPLLPTASRIMQYYSYQLPMISNGKYNAYLKEVAEVVGIEKHLTTHVGRKTCGTLLLNRGVPIETVSRILGHSSVKITQQAYAQVLQHKIARDTADIDL